MNLSFKGNCWPGGCIRLAAAGFALAVLAGCSSSSNTLGGLLGGEEEKIGGARESVVAQSGALKPDAALLAEPMNIPPAQTNSNWSQAGGSPDHVMGNLAISSSPRRVWNVRVGTGSTKKGRLTVQPVTGGGRIYIMDTAGAVGAFSTSNGAKVWTISIVPKGEDVQGAVGGGVAYHQGRLYVTTPFAEILSLSATNGSLVWRKKLNVPSHAAPTISNGRIFVVGVTNEVQALSVNDGSPIWSHQGVGEKASRASSTSAAVSGNNLVVPFTTGEVLGFNASTGFTQWGDALSGSNRFGASSILADVSARPVIASGHAYAIAHTGSMAAFRLGDGDIAWSLGVSGTQMPWLVGDYLFTVVNRNTLSAISRTRGRARWSMRLSESSEWAGPVMGNGALITASSSGQMAFVSPENGKVLRQIDLDEPVYISPIISDGTLYVLTDEATLMAFR
ncbi:MAG: PQQ-binding-like beta-propeller repeat protein [Hyphomicrobiales bacterium]